MLKGVVGHDKLYVPLGKDVDVAQAIFGDRNRNPRKARSQKKRFVADWIAKHGTAEQQARQTAGVLPMAEAIDAIAEQAFAPASGHPRYVRDGAARLQELLRANPEYPDIVVAPSDVIAETTVLKTATASQWAAVEKLRGTFPGGIVTLLTQRLQCRTALAGGDLRFVRAQGHGASPGASARGPRVADHLLPRGHGHACRAA